MARTHAGKDHHTGDGSPQDPTYSREKFYTSGKNAHDHSVRARDIRVSPWLMDIIGRLADEIPAYKGQFANVFRNYITHGVRYDIELIEDPKLKEALAKEFQLHADMEEQSRLVNRFADMQKYVNSTRAALSLYAETGNWMLVTREVERMKKNLTDGLLWEPCITEVRQLIGEYTEKLRKAKT